MQKQILVTSLLVLVLAFSFGCKKQNLPKDLPALYPTTITLSQEGKPLVDAIVTAVSVKGGSQWSGAGKTDDKGMVKLFVNGQYEGMPEGSFKVLVSKLETDPAKEVPPEPDPQKDRGAWAKWNQQYNGPHMMTNSYNLVEPVYADHNKTPLEIEVKNGKNEFTLDAGKAVKLLVRR